MSVHACSFRVLILAVAMLVVGESPVGGQEAKTKSSLAERLRTIKKSAKPGEQQTPNVAANATYARMLKSVGLIMCEDGHGTGWVLDVERRLLVTNHHVIDGVTECEVYFPEYRNGQLVTDPAESLTPARAFRATVVDSDQTADLALVRLDDAIPDEIIALDLAKGSATPGEKIHSIAGNTVGSQSLWIYSTGHVRQVVNGELANGYESTVLESDMATNQGNSGGPVCNDKGEIVAVVEGHATDARLVSIYVDLISLAEYLSEGLRCVDPTTLEDLTFAADRHFEDSRLDVSLQLATRALKLDPKSAYLYTHRGWCWYWEDDNDSARAEFEEALKLDRTFANAHFGLGAVARDENDYPAAIKHFTDAIRNEPESLSYLESRANARMASGDWSGAYKDFDALCRKDPDSPDPICQRAIALVQLGEYQRGVDDLLPIIDLYPEDDYTIFTVGNGLNGLERYQESLPYIRSAIEIDPEYTQYRLGLGLALYHTGSFQECAQSMAKAIELGGASAMAHCYLGLAMVELGDPAAAAESFRRVLALDQDVDYNRIAKNSLGELEATAAKHKTQTRQVASVTNIPRTYVDSWFSHFRHQGESIKMWLQLSANGRYSMRIVTVSPLGNKEDLGDAGTFSVNDSTIVRQSDEDNTNVSHPVKWKNGQMLLYVPGLEVWVPFTRHR